MTSRERASKIQAVNTLASSSRQLAPARDSAGGGSAVAPDQLVATRQAGDRTAHFFKLGELLQKLDLRELSWTLMDWLRLYDGFEQYLPAHDDPLLSATRSLAAIALLDLDGKPLSNVLDAIERQPFMRYRTRWHSAAGDPLGQAWPPDNYLASTFWDFVRDKPEGAIEIRATKCPESQIDTRRLRQNLAAGYLRFSSRLPPLGDVLARATANAPPPSTVR